MILSPLGLGHWPEQSLGTSPSRSLMVSRFHFGCMRDEELKRLRRLVRDLEFEARGRRWRRDHKEREEGSASVGGGYGETSHQSLSHQLQDRSRYTDRNSISLEG